MGREDLRCVVEPAGASWKAYCVDVAVCAEGASLGEARAALDGELERLCQEQAEVAPPPSTRERQLRYLVARCRSALASPSAGAPVVYVFRPPPQPVVGLA